MLNNIYYVAVSRIPELTGKTKCIRIELIPNFIIIPDFYHSNLNSFSSYLSLSNVYIFHAQILSRIYEQEVRVIFFKIDVICFLIIHCFASGTIVVLNKTRSLIQKKGYEAA